MTQPVLTATLRGRPGEPTADARGHAVGQRTPLIDGIEKVTGRARYTADLPFGETLVGRILRSPVAHGVIRSIDTTKARAIPGVRAVVTGEDFAAPYGVIPIAQNEWPLARGKVRYRGEPVAAVAALDEATAQAALAAIVLDIEPLPAYFNAADARAADAVRLHDKKVGNIEREVDQVFGDVDAGFAAADVVREQTFHYAEVAHGQIELNAAVAAYEPERDRLTTHSDTQVPYYLHLTLARCLGMDSSRIRVVKPFVGGGFGHRVEPLNFEMVTAALARAARDRHPAEDRDEEIRRDHRRRLRDRPARRRVRRLRSGDHPVRRRAAARDLQAAGRQVSRLSRLHEHATLRRDARPWCGGRETCVRVDARHAGRGARSRSVRGAPRQSDRVAVPDAERAAGELLRHPAMPRLGRAGIGMEAAPWQHAARPWPRARMLALRIGFGKTGALER